MGTISIRLSPPDQAGAFTGLLRVPHPSCLAHIHESNPRLMETSPQLQQAQERLQDARTLSRVIENRIEKIIRRLLLKLGIPVFAKEDFGKAYDGLFFTIKINIDRSAEGSWSSVVRMEFIQEVLLARDSSIQIEAVTWNNAPFRREYGELEFTHEFFARMVEGLGQHELETLRLKWVVNRIIDENIRKGVESFVCAYRRDNPVKRGRSYDTAPLDEK